uniref:SCP domain-containing protein n=1 Tax=Steinernema glaseri TaxID=37863 RepID=A0A1I7YTK5_9BILA
MAYVCRTSLPMMLLLRLHYLLRLMVLGSCVGAVRVRYSWVPVKIKAGFRDNKDFVANKEDCMLKAFGMRKIGFELEKDKDRLRCWILTEIQSFKGELSTNRDTYLIDLRDPNDEQCAKSSDIDGIWDRNSTNWPLLLVRKFFEGKEKCDLPSEMCVKMEKLRIHCRKKANNPKCVEEPKATTTTTSTTTTTTTLSREDEIKKYVLSNIETLYRAYNAKTAKHSYYYDEDKLNMFPGYAKQKAIGKALPYKAYEENIENIARLCPELVTIYDHHWQGMYVLNDAPKMPRPFWNIIGPFMMAATTKGYCKANIPVYRINSNTVNNAFYTTNKQDYNKMKTEDDRYKPGAGDDFGIVFYIWSTSY